MPTCPVKLQHDNGTLTLLSAFCDDDCTGPCQAVLDARAAEIRAAMLVYTDVEVIVEVIQEADLATAFNTAGEFQWQAAVEMENMCAHEHA